MYSLLHIPICISSIVPFALSPLHQTSHWICSSRAENFIRCSSLKPLDWTPTCPLGRLYLWLAEAGDWLSCLLQNQVNIQKTSCLSRRCWCPCASHESPAGVSYQPSQWATTDSAMHRIKLSSLNQVIHTNSFGKVNKKFCEFAVDFMSMLLVYCV